MLFRNKTKSGLTRRAGAALLVAGVLSLSAMPVQAQDSADLAKQLANPVSSLVSVPFQFNLDQDLGRRTTPNSCPAIGRGCFRREEHALDRVAEPLILSEYGRYL